MTDLCPSVDPRGSLRCERLCHDDNLCWSGKTRWVKGEYRYVTEAGQMTDENGRMTDGSDLVIEFVRAFVAIYEGIDGISDEQSRRDWELTQEHWVTYNEAKEYLAHVSPPEQPIPRVVLERMRERTDDPAALTEIERRLAKEGEA